MSFLDEEGLMSEEKFNRLVEEINLGDLSEVKEERQLIPPASKVKFMIRTCSADDRNKAWRVINLELKIVDGIVVGDKTKYKGKSMFQRVCFYADPTKYEGKDWFDKRQHLVEFVKLGKALGLDLKGVIINDGFLCSLQNQYVIGNIIQKKQKDYTNKEGRVVSGEIKNEIVNFQAVPEGSSV